MQVNDASQVTRFLGAAKEDRLYALYVLALDSGMRQGELVALQWADVDFTAGSVVVQRSLEEINGKLRLKDTKSAKGRRRIELSRFAQDALHEHRKAMLAEGKDVRTGPVFCAPEGGWLRKGNFLRRSFWPCIESANQKTRAAAVEAGTQPPDDLPVIRFHDLRHTCATLLLLADVNVKVVSERLGHASIQLTLDTYSHEMQKAAVAKMDGTFGSRAANTWDWLQNGYKPSLPSTLVGKSKPCKPVAYRALCLLAAAGIEPATRGL
jgi:integrase